VNLRCPSAYRHDVRQTLTGRAIIAVIVLTLLGGLASLITVESTTPYFSIDGSALYFYDNGAYHLLVWVYDAGGTPVSGAMVGFTATTGGTQNTTVGSYSVTSDSRGEISLVIPIADQPWVNLTVDSLRLVSTRSVTVLWGGFFFSPPPSLPSLYLGYLTPGVVDGIDTLVVAGTDYYSAHTQAMVFAAGSNGSVPTGLRLETCSTPQPYFPLGGQNSCMGLPTQELGPINGFWSHFPLPEYPLNASTVFVQVVNASGRVVQVTQLRPTATNGNGSLVVNNAPGAPILNDFATEASFLLPCMGIVAAYWVYARPRLSGSVEPVLAGPVTRRGLLLARYATVAGVVTVATLIEIVVLDASVNDILGEPLPVRILSPLFGGVLVAGLGSAGLVFLTAHLVKSPGTVLGSGTFPIIVGFFWSSVILGLLIINNPSYSASSATSLLLPSQLFFPPQFPSLTTSFLVGESPLGTPLAGSPEGVGLGLEAAIAAAWVIVPFLLTYRSATTRD
jgi:ABC-type transport system involved in multi-copper enzyme maturation permease subunit